LRITAWRIFKKKHKASAFTGEGARRYGGRWNSKGNSVLYTSQSPSLAILEILVHLQSHELLEDYLLASISFDENFVEVLPAAKLPAVWRRHPPPPSLQKLGDLWLQNKTTAVLQVPSVIVAAECNYLLNPAHPDFSRCIFGKPQPFRFDPRLAQNTS
jgi:RES domain-containing protein